MEFRKQNLIQSRYLKQRFKNYINFGGTLMFGYNINLNDVNEVLKLLRGCYPLISSEFDYGEPLPTATNIVLKEYIYCNSTENRKGIFEEAWVKLVNGSASDVYLAFDYFNGCLYYEQKNAASFIIDKNLFVSLLKTNINKHLHELENKVVFVDGTINEKPLCRIKRVNERYQKEYGFAIL